jgi:hypothetical protein
MWSKQCNMEVCYQSESFYKISQKRLIEHDIQHLHDVSIRLIIVHEFYTRRFSTRFVVKGTGGLYLCKNTYTDFLYQLCRCHLKQIYVISKCTPSLVLCKIPQKEFGKYMFSDFVYTFPHLYRVTLLGNMERFDAIVKNLLCFLFH